MKAFLIAIGIFFALAVACVVGRFLFPFLAWIFQAEIPLTCGIVGGTLGGLILIAWICTKFKHVKVFLPALIIAAGYFTFMGIYMNQEVTGYKYYGDYAGERCTYTEPITDEDGDYIYRYEDSTYYRRVIYTYEGYNKFGIQESWESEGWEIVTDED